MDHDRAARLEVVSPMASKNGTASAESVDGLT